MEYKQKSARLPRSAEEKEKWERVIIILEHCPLQSIQTDKGFELLSDRHRTYHAKRHQDPAEWRPDVVHQCLLHLQDSALNRAGKLEVYLHTKKGVCISIDPRLKVPRHMRLFEKMMVTLLFKMKIRASTGYLSLMRVVKNPITDHIPANTTLIRVEKDGDHVEDLFEFCSSCGFQRSEAERKRDALGALLTSSPLTSSKGESKLTETSSDYSNLARAAAERNQFQPFAFIIGGMSKGDVSVDYASAATGAKSIRLGDRGMSAAAVISQLLYGFEEVWLKDDNECC